MSQVQLKLSHICVIPFLIYSISGLLQNIGEKVSKVSEINVLQDSIETVAHSSPHCSDFTEPRHSDTDEMYISSPNYPGSYGNKLDCVFIIQAPSEFHKIRLEFRERFHLEYSKNCSYDFLQINDGPYGYSPLMARYCGNDTPPAMMGSAGPFLWLQFHSDNHLTENGFKIFFCFIKFDYLRIGPPKQCYKKLTIPPSHAALIDSSYLETRLGRLPRGFAATISECSFDIRVAAANNIFIFEVELNRSAMRGGRIVEVFEDQPGLIPVLKQLNQNRFQITRSTISPFQRFIAGSRVIIRFVFLHPNTIMHFRFVVTSLRLATNAPSSSSNKSGGCRDHEVMCENTEFCVADSLGCDGYRNCPRGEDERCWGGKVHTEEQLALRRLGSEDDIALAKKKKKLLSKKTESFLSKHRDIIILSSAGALILVLLFFCIGHSIYQNHLDHVSRHLATKLQRRSTRERNQISDC